MKRTTTGAAAPQGSTDFLNGVPELAILRILSRRPAHGYELVRAIRDSSQGALDFGEGCIYPLLHRLEREGMLASSPLVTGGRRRIVYRLTPAGHERLAASVSLWQRTVAAVQSVLQGVQDGASTFA